MKHFVWTEELMDSVLSIMDSCGYDPEEFPYLAIDMDGEIYVYKESPSLEMTGVQRCSPDMYEDAVRMVREGGVNRVWMPDGQSSSNEVWYLFSISKDRVEWCPCHTRMRLV